jgi:hypothetical protein
MYDVHELRRGLSLDTPYLRTGYSAAEKHAHLQEASSRSDKEIAGLSREHDRRSGRIDALVAEGCGGFAQSFPGVA